MLDKNWENHNSTLSFLEFQEIISGILVSHQLNQVSMCFDQHNQTKYMVIFSFDGLEEILQIEASEPMIFWKPRIFDLLDELSWKHFKKLNIK